MVAHDWDSVRVGEDTGTFMRFPKNKTYDVTILERALPKDTFPAGTVVRYRHPNRDDYRIAVKQSSGTWSRGGFDVNWPELLNNRPLTVLAESTVIE